MLVGEARAVPSTRRLSIRVSPRLDGLLMVAAKRAKLTKHQFIDMALREYVEVFLRPAEAAPVAAVEGTVG